MVKPPEEIYHPDPSVDLSAWMEAYKEEKLLHPRDLEILEYFEAYYGHPNGTKPQNRAFGKIMNILFVTGLLKVGETNEELNAMADTYEWLIKETLVITPALINRIEEYCREHSNQRSEQLRKHLEVIQHSFGQNSSRQYREAEKNIRTNVENLLEERNPEDQVAKIFFNADESVIWKEPRLKLFQCESPASIAESLATWIRGTLYFRRRDIRTNPKPGKEPEDSKTPDPRLGPETEIIARERRELLQKHIQDDSDQWLPKPIVQGNPELKRREVAKRIYLRGETIQEIAEKFEINFQTLYSAIMGNEQKDPTKNRWGLHDYLAGILTEYYSEPNLLRAAIQKDERNLLKTCHKKTVCDAQFLALRCLRVFGVVKTFEEISQELARQGTKLTPEEIETFWYKKCLHRIGRLIRDLDLG